MYLQILTRIYIIQVYISFLYGQDIKLLGLEYKQSVTKCASGFLNYVDKLVYKSIINFTRPSNEYIFSTFFIKERTDNDFKMLFTIHPFSDCMKRKDLDYYCEKDGENIFIVFFTLRAQPNYNGAVMKAIMFDIDSKEIKSDLLILPETYDVRNVTSEIIKINEVRYNIDDCRANISHNDLKLEFGCSSPATPCAIEILTDNSQLIERFNNSAVLRTTLNPQQIINVTLKYGACRLDGNHNNITCIIQANTVHDTGCSPITIVTITVITGTGCMFIFLLILVVLVIVRFRKLFANKDILKREEYGLLPCVDEKKEPLNYLDKSTLTDIFGLNVVLKCYSSSVEHKDDEVDDTSFLEGHVLHDEGAEHVIDLKKERNCIRE